MIKKKIFFLLSLLFCLHEGWAVVSLGGYVPFGRSTQKKNDGSKNTLNFNPALSFYRVFPFKTPFSHFILPEIGFVFHGQSEYKDYSKRTNYLLLDLGYSFHPRWMMRYGFGTFRTRIEGEGGNVSLGNGANSRLYYRPKKTVTSWNTTFNIGFEGFWFSRWVPRFEFFVFSPFHNTARKLSYLLSLNYVF